MSRNHQFIFTQDGSPSLLTTYESGITEGMHHSGGAAAESLYIYGAALKEGLHLAGSLRVMSLGLGLGYNELITAALAPTERFSSLITYEIDTVLKDNFLKWLQKERLEAEWQTGLDAVLNSTAKAVEVPPEPIRERLLSWHQTGSWQLCGAFPESLKPEDQFNVIFYDAFSRKMDEELWSEEFLTGFLGRHAAPECILATYAANGNLKRALKAQGFKTIERPGFSGKKQSTLAVRISGPQPSGSY